MYSCLLLLLRLVTVLLTVLDVVAAGGVFVRGAFVVATVGDCVVDVLVDIAGAESSLSAVYKISLSPFCFR